MMGMGMASARRTWCRRRPRGLDVLTQTTLGDSAGTLLLLYDAHGSTRGQVIAHRN